MGAEKIFVTLWLCLSWIIGAIWLGHFTLVAVSTWLGWNRSCQQDWRRVALFYHEMWWWWDGCNRPNQGPQDSLVQDCSISSVLAMEILQSFTKPSALILALRCHLVFDMLVNIVSGNGVVPNKHLVITLNNAELLSTEPVETKLVKFQ